MKTESLFFLMMKSPVLTGLASVLIFLPLNSRAQSCDYLLSEKAWAGVIIIDYNGEIESDDSNQRTVVYDRDQPEMGIPNPNNEYSPQRVPDKRDRQYYPELPLQIVPTIEEERRNGRLKDRPPLMPGYPFHMPEKRPKKDNTLN